MEEYYELNAWVPQIHVDSPILNVSVIEIGALGGSKVEMRS